LKTRRCYQDKDEIKDEETEGMDVNVAKRRTAMKIVKKVKKMTMTEITVILERIRGNCRTEDKGEWAKEKVMRVSKTRKLG
jgi:L-cysteine desulfidase